MRHYVEITRSGSDYVCRFNGQSTPAFLGPQAKLVLGGTPRTLGSLVQDFVEYRLQDFDDREQREVGHYLYTQIFGTTPPAQLAHGAENGELFIITVDEHVRRLPWMLLAYENDFLITAGWSIAFTLTREVAACELPSLPRLLVVMPQPKKGDWLPTKAEEHLSALKARLASVRVVLGSNEISVYQENKSMRVVLTWEDFVQQVAKFKPHLIYYYGHGRGDERSSRLIFEDKGNAVEKSLVDVADVLRNHRQIIKLTYINCCSGDVGGHLGAGSQLAGIAPAIVTNCTMTHVNAAQNQGLLFWEHVLLHGAPPHIALAGLRRELFRPELNLSYSDARWLSPVIYCNYAEWHYRPPQADAVEPKRKSKLDRTKQFGQLQGHISDMLDEGRPRALSFVWYGQRGQGVRLFHERITRELRKKLERDTVGFCPVSVNWPRHYHTDTCFAEMLLEACDLFLLEQLPEHLREIAGSPKRSKLVVYFQHPAVESDKGFGLKELKRYLEWLDRQTELFDDPSIFYVLGLPFIVADPERFDQKLSKEVKQTLELNRVRLRPLDKLGAVTLDDILDYFEEYHDNQRFSVRKDAARKIYERTGGRYSETVVAVLEAKFFAAETDSDKEDY